MTTAYKKNLWLKVGDFAVVVDLHSAVPSTRPTELKTLCPEHMSSVKRKYVCANDEHPVEKFIKARRVSGGFKVVNESGKPSYGAEDALEFVVMDESELDEFTFPSGSVYFCKPTPQTVANWEALKRVANKKALVTKGNFRRGNTRKLWRLRTFKNYLILQELIFPERVRAVPEEVTDVTVRKQTTTSLQKELESHIVDSTKFPWQDEGTAAFEKWVDETGEFCPDPEAPAGTGDMSKILDLAVKASKKKKVS